jgi:hypothetical protein
MKNIKLFEDFQEAEIEYTTITTVVDKLYIHGMEYSNMIPNFQVGITDWTEDDINCIVKWNLNIISDKDCINDLKIDIEDIIFSFKITTWTGDSDEETILPFNFNLKELRMNIECNINFNELPIKPNNIELDFKNKKIIIE